MDVQEAKLEELEGTGVGISVEGNNIRLIMPGNITLKTRQSPCQQFLLGTEFWSQWY